MNPTLCESEKTGLEFINIVTVKFGVILQF